MCLIFLLVDQHVDYKLIVAANRDEFYARKTAPASFWNDYPDLLAGRDLEAGGTWLGVTRKGRISMLTNYRDPSAIQPKAPSRGQLVVDFLVDNIAPSDYLQRVQARASQYNGFNLIAGTADALYYYSNYGKDVVLLPQGFHGLSNHLLNTPWPKVEDGKEHLVPVLRKRALNVAEVFDALRYDIVADDERLPSTGLTLERERALSAMFIRTPDYGSRCSTVLLIDRDDRVSFFERTYTADLQFSTQSFDFKLVAHEANG